MNKLTLHLRIPDDVSRDAYADLIGILAEAAHRATDWADGIDWMLIQDANGKATITPRHRPTSGGAA